MGLVAAAPAAAAVAPLRLAGCTLLLLLHVAQNGRKSSALLASKLAI